VFSWIVHRRSVSGFSATRLSGRPVSTPPRRDVSRRSARKRRGTAAVEFALALPVLLAFVFGLVECSRIRMTRNLLGAACRLAARHGSAEGVTSQDVRERAAQVLATGMNPADVEVLIKNAAVYDETGAMPETGAELALLPELELAGAESRQMFLVRVSVAYNDIALIPLPVLQGAVLTGQAFMRHE